MNKIKNEINDIFDESSNIILDSKKLSNDIIKAATLIIKSLQTGNKVIIFGNGGSAGDAQHMAAEFIGRFMKERKSFPAIALSADSSIVTALGNDYGFENIFSRQVESLIKKNDIIIAISTSGKSKNVLNGMKIGKKIGAKVISLTGNYTLKMKSTSNIILNVPSSTTSRLQEVHRIIIHIICELVENKLS